ncbi:hypothetical protein H8958_004849 [Nasalis larvatus]
MAVESRVTQEEIKKEPEKSIDREKTCLRLLSIFITNNGHHHRTDEFSQGNDKEYQLSLKQCFEIVCEKITELEEKERYF